MHLLAELMMFPDQPPEQWIVREPLASEVFPALPPSIGPSRVLITPGRPTYSGYAGIRLTPFESFQLARLRAMQGHADDWNTTTWEDPTHERSERLFRSAPWDIRAALGQPFEELVRPSEAVLPLGELKGAPVTGRLRCPRAPEFPMEAELTRWNASRANCYSYANNQIDTMHFALPGPGTRFTRCTKDDLIVMLQGDGLVSAGAEEPRACPVGPDGTEAGHFVAVFLRGREIDGTYPSVHCLRLDRDGFWSHRDGTRNPVQQLPVTSLHEVRLPYPTAFVGFFVSIEGHRVITSPES